MELEQKGQFGVTHIFNANMGDRTIATIRDYQGKRTGPAYENEIVQGDLVKLTGPEEVAKCEPGDTPIGIAMDDYDHEGPIPTTAATWGDADYDNNAIIKVETLGKVIKTVKLEPANTKISTGDPIKVGATTAGCYDKGASSNNNIALEDAAANSGALIKVLFSVTPL